MSAYTVFIPHDQPHTQSGNTFPRGLEWQRNRAGGPRVPILRGDNPIGKTVDIDTGPDGMTFTVEIGDRHETGYGYDGGGYYANPVVARGHLLGLDIVGIESWPDSELRPATPSRQYPSIPPLPPQLARLRHV